MGRYLIRVPQRSRRVRGEGLAARDAVPTTMVDLPSDPLACADGAQELRKGRVQCALPRPRTAIVAHADDNELV